MPFEDARQSRPAPSPRSRAWSEVRNRHHHSGRWRGETDRCVDGWVVDNLTELRRGIGWRREPAHDQADRAVFTLVRNFVSRLRQYLNRRAVRDRGWRSTSGERDFGVLRHQVLAEGRIL